MSREQLPGGVVEYTHRFVVGAGSHDRINVHRVVREGRSRRPVPSKASVFFVHGDLWGFDAAFAGDQGQGRRAPNVATYLAGKRFDVWGIDQRWVLVPPETTDTTFMRGWGFGTELSDLRLATTFQRQLRSQTSHQAGPTTLVGWSRGGQLAYAYAARESQLPRRQRNVSSLVAAETLFTYGPKDDDFRRGVCQAYVDEKAAYDAGQNAVSFGYAEVGRNALVSPSGPSDEPGLTNRQLALAYGSSVGGFFNATFHFLGARVDDTGIPTSLRFTPERRWFRLMTQSASWESWGDFVDGAAVNCGEIAVPYDDHLSDVRLPLLNLAAAGGFGTTSHYSTTLVGSKDVTELIVRLLPAGEEATDFGHVDLWQASNASQEVWAPLARWIDSHQD